MCREGNTDIHAEKRSTNKLEALQEFLETSTARGGKSKRWVDRSKSMTSPESVLHSCAQESGKRENFICCFPYWRFYLINGFNLILYGLGSKINLLKSLANEELSKDGSIVAVHGYVKDLNLKEVLSMILGCVERQLLTSKKQSPNLNSSAEEILGKLTSVTAGACVYVLIHSIDGTALSNRESQRILAALAACKCIHVVATMDNINTPLMWDQPMANEQFNWIWLHTPTFCPYVEETSNILPLTAPKEENNTSRSAILVLRSLTTNAKGVFRVLAECQLSSSGSSGLSFHQWYKMCREKFLVSSEVTLRTHQIEFRDHELVKIRKDSDGQDIIYVPMSGEELKLTLSKLDSDA